MVVASSNNAAVNNISKELPKVTSWGTAGVSRPTSANGSENCDQEQGEQFTPLSPDESQWGLVACLGNYANRKKFNEGFAFYPDKSNPEPAHRLGLFNIYDWIKRYSGPTFDEARNDFLSKQKIVEDELEERATFANLVEELTGQTEETYTAAALQEVDRFRQEVSGIKQDIVNSNESSPRSACAPSGRKRLVCP
jgi:hypothetical protein